MTRFTELTKRNIRLFFRDKGAVFFSLLAMFIVLILMVLFLSDINIDNITDLLKKLPMHDTAGDRKNAELLVLTWTAAGIIPINAVMVTLSSLSSIIKDKTEGRINSLYTSPVSRVTITLSYIAAACISSVLICTLTVAVSELYLVIRGLEAFSVETHLKIFGMILVNSFTYSAIMYLCAAIVKSQGAWSGVGTIIGTLVGFLGGVYMPIGSLSEGLKNGIGCTPVIYGTVMFRKVMTEGILKKTFADAPSEMLSGYREAMGIDLEMFGSKTGIPACIITTLGFGAAFALIGAAVTAFTKKRDR